MKKIAWWGADQQLKPRGAVKPKRECIAKHLARSCLFLELGDGAKRDRTAWSRIGYREWLPRNSSPPPIVRRVRSAIDATGGGGTAGRFAALASASSDSRDARTALDEV
jgi:hypothetical protein